MLDLTQNALKIEITATFNALYWAMYWAGHCTYMREFVVKNSSESVGETIWPTVKHTKMSDDNWEINLSSSQCSSVEMEP